MIMVIYIFFSDVRPVAQQSSLCIITLENIPVLEMFEQNLELMTWLNIHKETNKGCSWGKSTAWKVWF